MNKTLIGLIGLTLAGLASAKLPPPSDEAKAAAAEAKAKTAWSDKVAAYKLCLVQNKVVEHYRKNKPAQAQVTPATAAAGSTAPTPGPSSTAAAPSATSIAPAPSVSATAVPPAAIPACQDPGPYVAMQSDAKVGVADALPVPAAGKQQRPAAAKN